MTDCKKPVMFWATVGLSVAFVLTGIYGGAYAWMVTPVKALYLTSDEPPRMVVTPIYFGAANHRRWHKFFEPANWFDRKVRPTVWTAD